MKVELVKVASSNLAAVGYDKQAKVLRIQFVEGSSYDYFAVPAKLYSALMKSESKGSFFQEHVVGKYRFEKVNLEKERIQMGKNNQQKAAEARAKATAPAVQQPAEQPKPEQPAPAAAQPSKQEQTIAKLREAWTAKGVDLSKLTIKDDGKFKLLIVAEGWPTVQIGPTGGIVVLELRSYQKAFDAAIDGMALYQKQQGRDSKKSAPSAPAPSAAPTPAKQESTTAKKARKNAAIEKQLEARSA